MAKKIIRTFGASLQKAFDSHKRKRNQRLMMSYVLKINVK